MILKILLFLSDFQLDNILWVIFLFNKGVPFLFIAFLEFIFYSFYAITKHLIFFNQNPPKIFIIISPFLMLTAYVFIYLMNSYILLTLAFLLLAFSYYSYHDNLVRKFSASLKHKKEEKDSKKNLRYEPIIFLSIILSNYFGGLFANLSWKIFIIAVIAVKSITIPLSIISFKKISNQEENYFSEENIKRSFVKILKNSKIFKLFISKILVLSIFEFTYIYVAFKLRIIFVSPYYIGLLYSIEVIISIISLRYFYHFEALAGSYIGKFLTGIVFFSLTTLLFKKTLIPVALGFLFISMSKNLNESLLTMNMVNSIKISDLPTYKVKEELFTYLISSIIMFGLAIIYSFFGNIATLYSLLSLSLIYFALLIF